MTKKPTQGRGREAPLLRKRGRRITADEHRARRDKVRRMILMAMQGKTWDEIAEQFGRDDHRELRRLYARFRRSGLDDFTMKVLLTIDSTEEQGPPTRALREITVESDRLENEIRAAMGLPPLKQFRE